MQLSRRQLLKTTGISTALACAPAPLLAAAREKLVIPPLIEARRGRPISLTMQEMNYPLDGQHRVNVWGFNGNYLGPTIKIKSGSFAKLNYYNNLPQQVSLAVLGLQAPGELMSGVSRTLKTGESWAPIIPIEQPAGTCWYRANTFTNTAYQTYRGLVGMWLIDDEQTQKSHLPNKYGVDDIPLILQDMEFNKEGVQLFKPNQPHFMGNRLLVNGNESPYLEVARGWVRLRLVNASLARAYDLRLDNEQNMLLIAQDQGFLSSPKEINSLILAPGERAELLVNLNEIEGSVSLITGHKRGFFDKVKDVFGAGDDLLDNTVLELRVKGELSAFNQTQSYQFKTDASQILSQPIAKTRELNIDVTEGLINQKRIDSRIDIQMQKGVVERWVINATLPVGFSIQGGKFIVEEENGTATPEDALVWKDTIWVKKQSKILVRFDHASSNNNPFHFGVSNLMLADMGAQGIIIVQ